MFKNSGQMGCRVRGLVLSGLLALAALVPVAAEATAITKTLTVNVWDVCNDAGANCASTGPVSDPYFQAEVNKIWAQAGISVSFVFQHNINSTFYSNIDDSTYAGTPGSIGDNSVYALFGVSGSVNFANAATVGSRAVYSTTVENLYLVHTIVGAYGESWLGLGGMVIAMDSVMSYNGGLGRIDTIAHELGHNLGLPHYDTLASDLMASGGVRSVPATSANIAPSGLGYDYLTSAQIATARSSTLLRDVQIPEPSGMLLLLVAAAAATSATQRRP